MLLLTHASSSRQAAKAEKEKETKAYNTALRAHERMLKKVRSEFTRLPSSSVFPSAWFVASCL